MTPDEAMMRKLDDAGLHRARLMVAADLTHVVVDKARRLTEVPDPESEAFWLAYQGMFDAVRALDAMRLRDTIATSEQIVRDHVEVFDLPGRTSRESDFLAQWRADVERRANEFGGAS
jgi:hypothetical protein